MGLLFLLCLQHRQHLRHSRLCSPFVTNRVYCGQVTKASPEIAPPVAYGSASPVAHNPFLLTKNKAAGWPRKKQRNIVGIWLIQLVRFSVCIGLSVSLI